MRGHWISGTRKLNRHYQSGEGGERMKIIVKENRFAPTFPGVYASNIWQKKSTLSGYSEQYIEGVLKSGWIWEAMSQLTQSGIGYPFANAPEQSFKDSCDRIAKPYSRPSGWTFNSVTLNELNIWALCSARYMEGGEQKTNGLQPFRITVNSDQYKPTKFMTIKATSDPNIYDIMFSDKDQASDVYNADIVKIKNFFAKLKALNPTTPYYEYNPTSDSWTEISSSGGATPSRMRVGDQLFFYATTNEAISPMWGLYYSSWSGKVILPEVAVTL